MLINLSNHPTTKWSTAQQSTAEYYYHHTIEDIPFPDINPEWNKDEIGRLATEYRDTILLKNPAAVHIMGEMTFTYALVTLLKDAGIKCIASTTDRIVEEVDGKKVATFRFVQFREY
jgi:hypothetical protein